ncbi:hypothetical protein ACN23B_28510 (plasmid) [Anabaena sp. FACHB-709]|uniref:Uncharacterized protein n=2 Tax=Nostocaceae TaxID=1162 RepID=A0ABR8BQ21_9NOSO|nr:hypothetical protein [Anabaena cylindrica FACHB-318]MBD2255010.1 hypothetical protein [Nostoc parmelioides FACHB-3921]MBD2266869.1 hypothetical protein [Anabaena sp. FACHB-709]MBD2276490.1 hypothetical protein [Nostoc sp. PCC 7120 = FACHB-418]MBD2287098.1 hypothetical protein [Anabaena cylindrica FACHB-170]MBD2352886.1 hypothetical protein [Trichormus variabilis FACHB-171]
MTSSLSVLTSPCHLSITALIAANRAAGSS